jgi:hypothetical protein
VPEPVHEPCHVPDDAASDGALYRFWFAVIVTVYEAPVGDDIIRPAGAQVIAAVGAMFAIVTADEAVEVALFEVFVAVIV